MLPSFKALSKPATSTSVLACSSQSDLNRSITRSYLNCIDHRFDHINLNCAISRVLTTVDIVGYQIFVYVFLKEIYHGTKFVLQSV